MDRETITILYAFLKLCRDSVYVIRKGEESCVYWRESEIRLVGGALRDELACKTPKDYDIHICCEKEYITFWKATICKLEEYSVLFGSDNFEIMDIPGSLCPIRSSASFTIKFRGLILDIFVRPPFDSGYASLGGLEIPYVPFFVVNSCYTVLKERHGSLNNIYNYSYYNVPSTDSYITQAQFFLSCYEKRLTIHPFWKKVELQEDKAQNRLMQIHFLNRFAKMLKKGYTASEEEWKFYTDIMEIVKRNVCLLCHSEVHEEDEECASSDGMLKRLHIYRCCYGVVHDDCVPPKEKKRMMMVRQNCNCCGHFIRTSEELPVSIKLNMEVFSQCK